MKIQVTQDDIDKGRRYTSWCCPVALAVQRVVNHKVYVGRSTVQTDANDKEISLPYEAAAFVGAFDRSEPVQPFEFELEI